MDNSQYLEIFIDEGQEHLQALNQNLLLLEKNPKDIEIINEIFRIAHTLKGTAGTMGFNLVARLTHKMENVLDNVRTMKTVLNSNIVDVLFKCLDMLQILMEDIEKEGSEKERDISLICNTLEGLSLDNKNEMVNSSVTFRNNDYYLDEYHINAIKQGRKLGRIPYQIRVTLQPTCLLKAARAYIIFKAIEELGDIIHSIPPVQDIEDEKFDFSFTVVILSRVDKNDIYEELNNISEIESAEIDEVDLANEGQKNVIFPEQNMDNVKEFLYENKSNPRKALNNGAFKRTGHSIRVDIERLDLLMNLVSELIIIKNRIEGFEGNLNNLGVGESIEDLGRITSSLHDVVMKVRMVPIDLVFNRFPRLVRDLAKETDKEVRLNIYGADTEVDRTIIDEIGDPLVHLIRNAVDHGMDNVAERTAVGKEKIGNIDLIAYHDGDNVVIEVKDDGKGIDLKKVYEKAAARGLVQGEGYELRDQDIIKFLFDPGFSTAEEISDISGRGVGLDVVKTKIEALGGAIEVETHQGKGTKFIIRLPLTLSIIQALLIKVGLETYAIPLSSVREVSNIAKDQIKKVREQEVFNNSGILVPFVRLNALLGVDEDLKVDDKYYTVVIVGKGEKQCALSVSKLIGQQEIVIKSLGKYLSNIRTIAGATILGDGLVSLILDINHLI